jgi:pilus assembly protein Flp/PilA
MTAAETLEPDGHAMRSFITDRLPHRSLQRFTSDESGATAIEYALIASGVSIAVLGGVSTLGSQIMVVFYDKLLNLF